MARVHEGIVRSRRFRCLVVLGVLVVALAFGYLFRLHDVREAYQREVAVSQARAQAHEAKALEVAGRQNLEDVLALAQVRLRDARWRLSAGAGMEDLLEQLAASGRTHGLTLERFEAEASVMEGDYLRLPLLITVSGRYPALRLWLEEWGQQVGTLQLSRLSMGELEGRQGQLQLQLAVQAFHAGEMLPRPASLADEPARLALPVPRVNPFAPWSAHQMVDGLAGIPLEQLQMVGSLSRAGTTHAVLAFSGRLYRVAEGDRLGRDEGLVAHIDEGRLAVQERLFVAGRWQERSKYLVLHGHKDLEVMDERKAAVGGGDGAEPVDGRVGKGL